MHPVTGSICLNPDSRLGDHMTTPNPIKFEDSSLFEDVKAIASTTGLLAAKRNTVDSTFLADNAIDFASGTFQILFYFVRRLFFKSS